MIENSKLTETKSKFVKFRFEIITTCCATLFGTLFFAATWWFSGMQQWAVEAAVFGGIICGLGAWAFHVLVHEMDKMAEERRKKRDNRG